MRAVMMYGPRDVRVEDRPDPALMNHTDAIIEVSAACVCESDLWPYRGTDPISEPIPMGHEYVGVVQQVGDQVKNVRVGDFVVGSFFASDNTCQICQAGYQSRCVHAELMGGGFWRSLLRWRARAAGRATGPVGDRGIRPGCSPRRRKWR